MVEVKTSELLCKQAIEIVDDKHMYRGAYAGTVKRHNVCKHHFAIDTGVKQTEHTIFLHVMSMGLKL